MNSLVVIILAAIGIIIGLITVYLAVWSEHGIIKTVKDGFYDIGKDTSKIKQSVDRDFWGLIDVIKAKTKEGHSIEKKLKHIGMVTISADVGEEETIYLLEFEKPIVKGKFMVKKARETKDFIAMEKKLFGEKETTIFSVIPNIARVIIPSANREACSEFMTFFLKWLDTTYYEGLKDLGEFEKDLET